MNGSLRIYLGAAPGVGKTMAMLAEGHRRAARGQDVVLALCETHSRPQTEAMAEGLELIPRRTVDHRGTTLTEMDLDAVLARKPDLALVDELAHTNAPGSRNEKRWQDVHDLQAAGISVISTVNVQHLESLNDVVEQITGIEQAETVPDAVVRSADQIELVDMTPEALRRRMAHGNIYAATKVDAALANYFRVGNLSALRELALLWVADRVEEGLDRYRDQHDITTAWPTRERVVVALSGGREGEALLRRAARIVSRGSGSELIALHVARGDGVAEAGLSETARLRRMAEELGGTFHSISGDDPAQAVLTFARAHNATLILIGTSRRSRWRRAISSGIGDDVIAGSGDIDVHVVTHDEGRLSLRLPRRRAGLSRRRQVAGLALAVLGPIALAPILLVNPPELTLTSLLFLLLTVAVTVVGGLIPALLAAVVSSLVVNYFFTEPTRTMTIADPHNVAALVVFVLVAWLVAAVVTSAARRAAEAVAAQRETAGLVELSHTLLGSTQQLDLLLSRALDMFGASAAAVRPRQHPDEVVAATELFASSQPVSAVEEAGDEHELVLQGAIVAPGDTALYAAFGAHAGAILQRRALQASADAAEELARDGRARTALLSAVSHDLRTPLASIKAAIGGLRSAEVNFTPEDRAELEEAIEDSADRLEELIGNLLAMSRLQAGVVVAHPTTIDLGELIPAVVKESGQGRVDWSIDDHARWAMADAGLLDRVLANVVENAVRHQPEPGRVVVATSRLSGVVEVRIVDTGPGVPEADKDAIFQPFQRRGDVPQGNGVGLGLAVARGLAEAMGATVRAEDTPGGGLTMVVALSASEGV